MSSHRWHNFPLNWGFKLILWVPNHHFLTLGFFNKNPRVGKSWFNKGSESPLILKPPFKRNLFDSYIFTHIDISIKRLSWLLDGTVFFKRKMEPICLPGQMHFVCISYAFYMRFICVLKKCMHFFKKCMHFLKKCMHFLKAHIKRIWTAYEMHIKCIWNAYEMHIKCIWNAYEMHMKCIWNARGFVTFLLFFFRFKSFVVATCDCYLIKQHSYFWLLLAISTCDCYVRYIHIVTFDCYLLLLLVNSPFTQLLVIGTCELYLWLVYFWFVLVIDTCD